MNPIIEVHASNKSRLYEAMGQIAVSYKALELTIEGIIFCSMQVPAAQARIFLAGMPFGTKVTNMNAIIRSGHIDNDLDGFVTVLNDLVERCRNCEKQSSEWLRSCWVPVPNPESGYVQRLQRACPAGNSTSLEVDSVSLSELEGFAACLNATVKDLRCFHQALFSSFGRIRAPQVLDEYMQAQLAAENDP